MNLKKIFHCLTGYLMILGLSLKISTGAAGSNPINTFGATKGQDVKPDSSLIYINTFIENGSPVNWERIGKDTILINLTYNYERVALNRATEHWHFLLNAKSGCDFTLIFKNFDEIYNGKLIQYDSTLFTTCIVSKDGKKWEHVHTERIEGDHMKVKVHMDSDSLYVAHVEPYRISDLQKLILRIKGDSRVKIMPIGKSVEGRELNIIQIGNENAPHRIFIRARAHAWEPGGNWVVEGIINTLLQPTDVSMNYLKNYVVYILPMANIDGVAHGITRFNLNGMDLNRKLTQTADPILSPENAAMEHWLESMIAKGLKPDLAIDFHNDTYGPLFFAPLGNETGNYEKNMLAFVKLLGTETWFTGGYSFAENSSFEVGMMRRYGIEAMIFELNAQWIKGLNKKPLSEDWLLLGNQLCKVFNEYFSVIKR